MEDSPAKRLTRRSGRLDSPKPPSASSSPKPPVPPSPKPQDKAKERAVEEGPSTPLASPARRLRSGRLHSPSASGTPGPATSSASGQEAAGKPSEAMEVVEETPSAADAAESDPSTAQETSTSQSTPSKRLRSSSRLSGVAAVDEPAEEEAEKDAADASLEASSAPQESPIEDPPRDKSSTDPVFDELKSLGSSGQEPQAAECPAEEGSEEVTDEAILESPPPESDPSEPISAVDLMEGDDEPVPAEALMEEVEELAHMDSSEAAQDPVPPAGPSPTAADDSLGWDSLTTHDPVAEFGEDVDNFVGNPEMEEADRSQAREDAEISLDLELEPELQDSQEQASKIPEKAAATEDQTSKTDEPGRESMESPDVKVKLEEPWRFAPLARLPLCQLCPSSPELHVSLEEQELHALRHCRLEGGAKGGGEAWDALLSRCFPLRPARQLRSVLLLQPLPRDRPGRRRVKRQLHRWRQLERRRMRWDEDGEYRASGSESQPDSDDFLHDPSDVDEALELSSDELPEDEEEMEERETSSDDSEIDLAGGHRPKRARVAPRSFEDVEVISEASYSKPGLDFRRTATYRTLSSITRTRAQDVCALCNVPVSERWAAHIWQEHLAKPALVCPAQGCSFYSTLQFDLVRDHINTEHPGLNARPLDRREHLLPEFRRLFDAAFNPDGRSDPPTVFATPTGAQRKPALSSNYHQTPIYKRLLQLGRKKKTTRCHLCPGAPVIPESFASHVWQNHATHIPAFACASEGCDFAHSYHRIIVEGHMEQAHPELVHKKVRDQREAHLEEFEQIFNQCFNPEQLAEPAEVDVTQPPVRAASKAPSTASHGSAGLDVKDEVEILEELPPSTLANKTYQTEADLNSALQRFAQGPKSARCSLCGEAVSFNYSAHVWTQHVRRPIFRCPVPSCAYFSVYFRSSVDQHMANHHPQLRAAPAKDCRVEHLAEYERTFNRCFRAGGAGEAQRPGLDRPWQQPPSSSVNLKTDSNYRQQPLFIRLNQIGKRRQTKRCQLCPPTHFPLETDWSKHVWREHMSDRPVWRCPHPGCPKFSSHDRCSIAQHLTTSHPGQTVPDGQPLDQRGDFIDEFERLFVTAFCPGVSVDHLGLSSEPVASGSSSPAPGGSAGPVTSVPLGWGRGWGARETPHCQLCPGKPLVKDFADKHLWGADAHMGMPRWVCPVDGCPAFSTYTNNVDAHIRSRHPGLHRGAVDNKQRFAAKYMAVYNQCFNPSVAAREGSGEGLSLGGPSDPSLAAPAIRLDESPSPEAAIQAEVQEGGEIDIGRLLSGQPPEPLPFDPLPPVQPHQASPANSFPISGATGVPWKSRQYSRSSATPRCQVCQRSVVTSKERHVWEYHMPDVAWALKCPLCPFTQSSPATHDRQKMEAHMEQVHGGAQAPLEHGAEVKARAANLQERCFPPGWSSAWGQKRAADPAPSRQLALGQSPLHNAAGSKRRCALCGLVVNEAFSRHVWKRHINDPKGYALKCPHCEKSVRGPADSDRQELVNHILQCHGSSDPPDDSNWQRWREEEAKLIAQCFPSRYSADARGCGFDAGVAVASVASAPGGSSVVIREKGNQPKCCVRCGTMVGGPLGSALRHVWDRHIPLDWALGCPYCSVRLKVPLQYDEQKLVGHIRSEHPGLPHQPSHFLRNGYSKFIAKARELEAICFPKVQEASPARPLVTLGDRPFCQECRCAIREAEPWQHVLAAHMSGSPGVLCPLADCSRCHPYDVGLVAAHIRQDHPAAAAQGCVPNDRRNKFRNRINQLLPTLFCLPPPPLPPGQAQRKAKPPGHQGPTTKTPYGICYHCGMQNQQSWQLRHSRQYHKGAKVLWLDLHGVVEHEDGGERQGCKFVPCAICKEKVRRARKGLHILRNHTAQLGPALRWECPWQACDFAALTKDAVRDHQPSCRYKHADVEEDEWHEDSAILRISQMHHLLNEAFGDPVPEGSEDKEPEVVEAAPEPAPPPPPTIPAALEMPLLPETAEVIWQDASPQPPAASASRVSTPGSAVSQSSDGASVLSKCRLCGRATEASRAAHEEHVKEAHLQQCMWLCPVCPHTSRTRQEILLHFQRCQCPERHQGLPCQPVTHAHCAIGLLPIDRSPQLATLIAAKVQKCFNPGSEGPRAEDSDGGLPSSASAPSLVSQRSPPPSMSVRPQPPQPGLSDPPPSFQVPLPPPAAPSPAAGPSGILECRRCRQKLHSSRQLDHIVDRHVGFDLVLCPLCEISHKWDVREMERHLREVHAELVTADPGITPIRRGETGTLQRLHADCFPGQPRPAALQTPPPPQHIELAANSPVEDPDSGVHALSLMDDIPPSPAPLLPPPTPTMAIPHLDDPPPQSVSFQQAAASSQASYHQSQAGQGSYQQSPAGQSSAYQQSEAPQSSSYQQGPASQGAPYSQSSTMPPPYQPSRPVFPMFLQPQRPSQPGAMPPPPHQRYLVPVRFVVRGQPPQQGQQGFPAHQGPGPTAYPTAEEQAPQQQPPYPEHRY